MIFFEETGRVEENAPPGVDVGSRVDATDADNDPLIFTLEGTDAASFNLVTLPDSARLRTKTGVTYDYETKSSYSVIVKVDDGHGGTATASMTINVTDVNEKPDTPTAPRVTGTSGSTPSLDVRWTKPGLNGGPDITGYEVQYRKGTSGPFTSTSHSGTGTSTTITELDEDAAYQVQVKALNGETPSDWSPSGSGSTSDLPVLSVAPARATEGTPISFTVTLRPMSSQIVTVDYATSVEPDDTAVPGTDYTETSGRLRFAAGDTTEDGERAHGPGHGHGGRHLHADVIEPVERDAVAHGGERERLDLGGYRRDRR